MIFIMENGKKINWMVKEAIKKKMVNNLLDTGEME